MTLSLGATLVIINTFAQEDTNYNTLILPGGYVNFIDNRLSGSYDSYLIARQYQGYLGIMAPGETIETLPGLAENWTHNVNRTEWTITLRKGIKLHDGSFLDAKTVRYSVYANYMASSYAERSYYVPPIDNLSHAIDDCSKTYINITFPDDDPNGNGYTVILSGSFLSNPIIEVLFSGGLPDIAIVPYGSHGSYSDTTEVCQTKLNEFSKNPISAGPYKFKEWNVGNYVLLERFDNWFGWNQTLRGSNGKYYTFPTAEKAFKYVKFLSISNQESALEEFKRGEIDILFGLETKYTRETLVEINNTEGVSVLIQPNVIFTRLTINHQGDWPSYFGGPGNFPISQSWFRQAVSHALNRELLASFWQGLANGMDTFIPNWVITRYSNINTSKFYNFTQGMKIAEEILDANGYVKLGFPEEPDNRFGWGPYANETKLNGKEQSRGRHFILLTQDKGYRPETAISIKRQLKEIGIYVDLDIKHDRSAYLNANFDGSKTPGSTYNTSYIDLGIRDPEFKGPYWDFVLLKYNLYTDSPWDCMAYRFWFDNWWTYGFTGSDWYNQSFEIAQAKVFGDNPYPVLRWSNEDTQFTEACEEAGRIMTYELPYIPLLNHLRAIGINDHVQNFVVSSDNNFYIAYSYWSTLSSTTSANSSGFEIYILLSCAIVYHLIIWARARKRR
ncbi:MAG: ABC transporter substrate-binding protein [Candidatus Kariarchaeaceae archaeon]